jgi:hypothetical protein
MRAALLLLLLLVPSPAEAAEREHKLGLQLGLSMLKVGDKSTMSTGFGTGLAYSYGLSDAFNLMAEGSFNLVATKQEQDFPDSPRTRPASVSHAGVGVGYVFDVLSWVPYVGLLGGGYYLDGGTLDKARVLPGLGVALGLDYKINFKLAVGVAARQHLMITDLSTYPSFTQVFAKVEYTWGW